MEGVILNELIAKDEKELTIEQESFLNLHKEIIFFGSTAADCLIHMSGKLKDMRDTKLYRQAGYKTFDEYVENAAKLKVRQAYNYIYVYENLPKDFLQSNAKIGITKLLLLSQTPNEDREEIVKTENISEITVKELEVKVKALEDEKSKSEEQLTLIKDKDEKLNSEKDKLSKELENSKVAAEKLKKQVDELKNIPAEVKQIDNPETIEKLEKATSELKDRETEIETLKKQLVIVSNQALTKFNILFGQFQTLGADMVKLLSEIDEEKRGKCAAAMKSVISGWNL